MAWGLGVDRRPADGLQAPHRAPKALCGSCDARDAGATAGGGAKERLAELREQYKQQEKELTVTIARRELRRWLRTSDEGMAVENTVGPLLSGG